MVPAVEGQGLGRLSGEALPSPLHGLHAVDHPPLLSEANARVDVVALIERVVLGMLVAAAGLCDFGNALGADLIRPERVGIE